MILQNSSLLVVPSPRTIQGLSIIVPYSLLVESPKEEGLIWAGSDDGLIHITRDGGENWENVTPPGMPEWNMINSIDVDPFVDGGAYVAATMYKSGDYAPYLYKTKDYGKTWTKITNGIADDHFTRVVRADPKRQGLLYAGTETGMYISFDDGVSWKPFQLNLPIVPITDLTIKNDNLIAATQGRSLWLIDDLTPLHQLKWIRLRLLIIPLQTHAKLSHGRWRRIFRSSQKCQVKIIPVVSWFTTISKKSQLILWN